MIEAQEVVMEAVPVQRGAAVEVRDLRKEFRRKDSRKRGEKRRFHSQDDGLARV